MAKRLFGLWIIVALALGVTPALAQPPQPAIIAFESSLDNLTLDKAEAGSQTTELSWYTANVTAGYRLRLLAYRRGMWEPVFGEESVPLEPRGMRVVTVQHPQTFAPPTYLLSIVDNQQRIIDQRTLTIPYDVAAGDDPPTIQRFAADILSLDAAALANGTALVQVAWQVTGRAPGSNLKFEQVFEDGTAQSIELPRVYLWVPSAGQGPVAPVLPQVPGSPVRIRLLVQDLISGNVYDEETITLEVIGFAARPPLVSTPVAPTPAPVVPPVQQGSTQILSFTANPSTVNPGAAVTLSWEIRGTGGVSITQSVPNSGDPVTVVNAQSPKGSATVYVPDRAAYSVDYTLYTADQSAYQTHTVRVHCPYTFFFGEGDGCPSSPPVEIPGAVQAFEGGRMVWRGDTHEIYVLYESAPGQPSGASYFLEGSYNALPETPLDGAIPPLDRVAPAQGFGKVWANAPGVRDRLGWALGPEMPVTLTVQQVALTRIPMPEFVIYLRLPDGSVIGTGASQWRVVQPAP